MKDRDGFPNPMDMNRERDRDRWERDRSDEERYYADREQGWDSRPDYETQGPDRSEMSNRRPPRRSRAPRFGRMGGGPYSGYSGFGGPGWTPGGYGDPGYNTSGFGHPDYGMSRTGPSTSHQTAEGWGGSRTNEWSGPHAGRGPKSYRRSDERILDDVCERLTVNGYVNASEVEIQVAEGEVTLSGTVEDRQQKYIAEELAESVSGVRTVDNRIRVARRD